MKAESELARERVALVEADRDLLQGERRIAAQERVVRDLRVRGHDSDEAERFLHLLRDTLEQWRGHRALIVQRIAYLENNTEVDAAAGAAATVGSRP